MPCNGVFPGKSSCDNIQPVVATTATRAGMTRVQVGIILDVQMGRGQGRQAFAHLRQGIAAHAGRAFLNGLTATFSYTPAAT